VPLLAAYNFDDLGSATIVDRSGNGHDITLAGQPGAQVDSGGLLDDGALGKTGAGLIPLPTALQTAFEVDDRSIMLDALGLRSVWWVRAASDSLGTGVFGLLSLDAATIISRARTQANVGPSNTITLGALSASVRHNFCLTYKRSTGVLTGYYDGVLVGTATFAPGTQLYVGADEFDIAEWTDVEPAVDNLRFFDHALTDTEVADLAGTPVTAAAEEHSGTVTLTAAAAITPAGTKAAARGVPLAAAAALAPAGRKTAARAATLTAAAATVPSGARASAGSVALEATGTAAVAGIHAGARAAGLGSTAALEVSGASVRSGTVRLSAVAHLEAEQSGVQRDVTLTASLATQSGASVSVGAQRWTATLGAQP
jgi:hypothetical protein